MYLCSLCRGSLGCRYGPCASARGAAPSLPHRGIPGFLLCCACPAFWAGARGVPCRACAPAQACLFVFMCADSGPW